MQPRLLQLFLISVFTPESFSSSEFQALIFRLLFCLMSMWLLQWLILNMMGQLSFAGQPVRHKPSWLTQRWWEKFEWARNESVPLTLALFSFNTLTHFLVVYCQNGLQICWSWLEWTHFQPSLSSVSTCVGCISGFMPFIIVCMIVCLQRLQPSSAPGEGSHTLD